MTTRKSTVEDVPALLDMLSRSGAARRRGVFGGTEKRWDHRSCRHLARGLNVAIGLRACARARRSVRLGGRAGDSRGADALQQSQLLARIASTQARLGGWAVDLSESTSRGPTRFASCHDVPWDTGPSQEAVGLLCAEHRAAIGHAVAGALKRHALRSRARDPLGQNQRLWFGRSATPCETAPARS